MADAREVLARIQWVDGHVCVGCGFDRDLGGVQGALSKHPDDVPCIVEEALRSARAALPGASSLGGVEVREVDRKIARRVWRDNPFAEDSEGAVALALAEHLAPERSRAARVEKAASGLASAVRQRIASCQGPLCPDVPCRQCEENAASLAALEAVLKEKP